jgi:hypothetical protein
MIAIRHDKGCGPAVLAQDGRALQRTLERRGRLIFYKDTGFRHTGVDSQLLHHVRFRWRILAQTAGHQQSPAFTRV